MAWSSLLQSVIFFCLGLLAGGFLNRAACRLSRGEPVFAGPSRCPACGAALPIRDRAPLFSYLVLRGRCRFCRAGISPGYPLVEAASGLCFAFFFLKTGYRPELLRNLVLFSFLLTISLCDVRSYRIPNVLVGLGSLAALFLLLLTGKPALASALLGLAAGALPLLVLALAFPGGMGMGDVKLAAMLGLYLGWPLVWLAVFLGAFLASLAGVGLLLAGRKKRKDPLPFGPFLAAGALVVLILGPDLLRVFLP